jgi:hypothetical protein
VRSADAKRLRAKSEAQGAFGGEACTTQNFGLSMFLVCIFAVLYRFVMCGVPGTLHGDVWWSKFITLPQAEGIAIELCKKGIMRSHQNLV